jgi:tetratricopeptide (TPR) repeat protein
MLRRSDEASSQTTINTPNKPRSIYEQDLRLKLAAFPNDSHTWYLLAQLYHSQENFEVAERALRKAISLNPSPIHFWYELSVVLKDMGRIEEAAAIRVQLRKERGDMSQSKFPDTIESHLAASRKDDKLAQEESKIQHSPCIDCKDYSYYGCSKSEPCTALIEWQSEMSSLI